MSGNDLELAISEGGGSGDNKQLQNYIGLSFGESKLAELQGLNGAMDLNGLFMRANSNQWAEWPPLCHNAY